MDQFTNRRDFLKLFSMGVFGQFMPRIISAPILRNSMDSLPNILILVFDAWTAKNTSFYGYNRETMPNLSRLLDRAIVFHNHHAAGPFTTPGTASLLTGRYPWSHRAIHGAGIIDPSTSHQNIFRLLKDDYYQIAYTHNPFADYLLRQLRNEIDTYLPRSELYLEEDIIFDLLLGNDFEISNSTKFFSLFDHVEIFQSSLLLQRIHLAFRRKTFKEWEKLFPKGIPKMGVSFQRFVLEDGIDWLSNNLKRIPTPFFAYFHFLPPHSPYYTRLEFADVFKRDGYQPITKPEHLLSQGVDEETTNEKRRHYDEYLLYVDAEFNRLFTQLDSQGVLDNLWIFLTSDHGEYFERGEIEHLTRILYQPVIHVPLLIFSSNNCQRMDIHTPTSAIDIVPTILKLTGIDVPTWCEGIPLPMVRSEEKSPRSVFAIEASYNPVYAPLKTATVTMIRGRFKVMKAMGYKELGKESLLEVYDLHNDPEELNNLVSSQPQIVKNLVAELDIKLEKVNRPYKNN